MRGGEGRGSISHETGVPRASFSASPRGLRLAAAGGLRHKGERGPGGATRSPAALVGARGFVAVLALPMFPPAAFRAAHVLFSLVFMFAFRMF